MFFKREKPAVGADGLRNLNRSQNIVSFPENQSKIVTLYGFSTYETQAATLRMRLMYSRGVSPFKLL